MRPRDLLRHLAIDLLAQRDDRCYWRQAHEPRPLPPSARLVLWQPDGKLGDGIINARLVHDLRVQRPDVQVHVVCPPGMLGFWRELPGVHAVHSCEAGVTRKALVTALQGCEALVSFETFLSLDTVRLVRALRPGRSIGFSVSQYRLFTDALVDTTYAFPRQHIGQRLVRLCELLALTHLERSDVADCTRRRPALPDLAQQQGLVVFFNTYAANADRCLTPVVIEQVRAVLREQLPYATVVLSFPAEAKLQVSLDEHTLALQPTPSVWDLLQRIDACDVVISPDTAIGHLGAALGKPVVVFYRDRHYNPVVWRPQCEQIHALLPEHAGDINSCSIDAFRAALSTVRSSTRHITA
jgi:ADP-heptose:LPS heptosyltransferase